MSVNTRLDAKQQEVIRAEVAEQLNSFKNDSIHQIISAAVIKALEPLIEKIDNLTEMIRIKDEKIDLLDKQNQELILKQARLEETIVSQNARNIKLRAELHEKSDDWESYSRKDSVRISGIEITPDEDNDALTEKLIMVYPFVGNVMLYILIKYF